MVGFAVGVGISHGWRVVRRTQHRFTLDTLTGVPTRAAAQQVLKKLGAGDAVVMLDLDGLKATNDSFGHGAGDHLLSATARHLVGAVRTGDLVARWGGDEFVIVLRAGDDAALEVVERLRASSPAEFSAGICVHRSGDGLATLAAADTALLAAKRAGGRRVVRA